MRARRLLWAVVVTLLTAPAGAIFAFAAFAFAKMVFLGLWYGVFERPDFREDTGDVTIFRATDPDWFWSNVHFYAYVAVIFGSIAIAILLPLALYLGRLFSTSDRASYPPR